MEEEVETEKHQIRTALHQVLPFLTRVPGNLQLHLILREAPPTPESND